MAGVWGGLGIEKTTGLAGETKAASEFLGVSVVGEPIRVRPKAAALTEEDKKMNSREDLRPVTDLGAAAVAQASSLASKTSESGDGNSAGKLADYVSQIRSRIGESLRYPLALRRRGIQGRVGLRLTLGAEGQVQAREISERSGSDELDELALEAVSAAQPYPPPSTELKKKVPLILNLPIEFKLH